jgi:hypothetical protein
VDFLGVGSADAELDVAFGGVLDDVARVRQGAGEPWSDSSTRHNLYGVLLILGLVGSVLAAPFALVSFSLCRAARKRAGAPPRLAAMLGSAVGAVLALGAATMILLTP